MSRAMAGCGKRAYITRSAAWGFCASGDCWGEDTPAVAGSWGNCVGPNASGTRGEAAAPTGREGPGDGLPEGAAASWASNFLRSPYPRPPALDIAGAAPPSVRCESAPGPETAAGLAGVLRPPRAMTSHFFFAVFLGAFLASTGLLTNPHALHFMVSTSVPRQPFPSSRTRACLPLPALLRLLPDTQASEPQPSDCPC